MEGLLALGTVRGHLGINAPNHAIINDAEYNLKLFHSNNRRHIRTFYPVFLRAVKPRPKDEKPKDKPKTIATPSSIRVIAALINPKGNDVGLEAITLINTSPDTVALNNWSIVDKNDKRSNFSIPEFLPGNTHKLVLDGRHAQLSNKGGIIKLINQNEEMVHLVSYSREQVREQGRTILF